MNHTMTVEELANSLLSLMKSNGRARNRKVVLEGCDCYGQAKEVAPLNPETDYVLIRRWP